MDSFRLITSALLISLNAACASATSSTDVADVTYRLPELKFDIKAEYQLRACGVGKVKAVDANGNETEKLTSFIKVKSKAEVSPQYVAGAATYVFSPGETAARKKRSDHEFALSLRANGTLESFNSTVTDKTGSIIGSAIKFATNVLTLGFAALADAEKAVENNTTLENPCVDEIVPHLKEAQKYADAIKTHSKKLTDLLTNSSISENEGKEIARLQEAIAALESELTDYRMENLTLKHTFTIEPAGLKASNLLSLPTEKIGKWIKKDNAGVANKMLLDLALSEKPTETFAPVTADSTSLLVLKPVMSTYRLCRITCPSSLTHTVAEEELARGQVQVPQWGQQQVVDFKVKTFEKRTINMTFNEAGAVTKLAWSKPSRADTAFSALAGASEAAVGLLNVGQYGRELAETNALKVETDLISQRNALREARNKQDALFSTEEAKDPGPETIQVILVVGDGS